MDAMFRRRVDRGSRTRDFIRAHPWEGLSYTSSLALLEGLLTRSDELAAQQRAGQLEASAAVARTLEVKRTMQSKLFPHLVVVGGMAGKERPDLAAEFKLPEVKAAHRTYLTTVKGLLATAVAERELLVSKGMSETLPEEIASGVRELEALNEKSSSGRRNHVGARADLEVVTVEIGGVVKFLDGLVRYRFGNDPELMAAWNSARSMFGPSKGRGTGPEASDGSVAPAA